MAFIIEETIEMLTDSGKSKDLIVRDFFLSKRVSILYFRSLIKEEVLIKAIFEPLCNATSKNITFKMLKDKLILTPEIEIIEDMQEAKDELYQGKALILVEKAKKFICVDLRSAPSRQPDEPPTSAVIQGPREGFTESVATNIGLLRKRIKSPKFIVEEYFVGKYTKTKVLITYIEDIINPETVTRVREKITSINIDGIIDSNYIITFLQNGNYFYKTVGTTEKPDVACAKILEGRLAILVDGSPIALTIPFLVFEDIQNSNDYYTSPIYSSFVRVIRILGILTATIVPGVYLTLRLYHSKIVPIKFLTTINNSSQNLPFTPFIELIFILLLFQILYEVSLRLPRYLGLATSVVGALILGDTGVNAGLISPPSVVIVAMSIISIYTVPDQAPHLTLLRAVFLVLGGALGILGIVGGMVYFINDMSYINDYGTPYLAPYGPRITSDEKDGIFMKPISKNYLRPKSLNPQNKRRIKNGKG